MEEADILKVKGMIKGLKPSDPTFEGRWAAVVSEYRQWEREFGDQTSLLNQRLELLRLLRTEYSDLDLLTDRCLVDAILLGTLAVGATFEGQTPDGTPSKLRVVDRRISPRYGVVYTLETPDGQRFTREYFD